MAAMDQTEVAQQKLTLCHPFSAASHLHAHTLLLHLQDE
jgi:hypothetical protein